MNFKSVLTTLLKGFEENGVHYGLIGRFVFGYGGVGRPTIDLDFLDHIHSLYRA
jgi:hypothetical protein